VAALVPAQQVYLVVGVTTHEEGGEAGNKFGLALGVVASPRLGGLGLKIDAFEPGVVEVREADLGRFLEKLRDELGGEVLRNSICMMEFGNIIV
jgi:hypothetical protein